MGLNRELRTLNNNILTDKQERQQERQQEQQEKKELKEAILKEKLMLQELENKIKDKINFYLSMNFYKYKSDLYLFKTKENIKNEILNPKPKGIKTPLKKEDFDFENDKIQLKELIFLYFDKLYYKVLKEQIKIHEMHQKALLNKHQQFLTTTPSTTPNTTPNKNKLSIWQIIFLFFFHFFNILNLCLCGFSKNKRRL